MKELVARPLTPAAFAPFGQAFSASSLGGGVSANQGSAVRFDHCAKLLNTRVHALPNLVVFRSEARHLPFDVQLLERHPCSTQVFIPMVISRYLVCVAPTLPDGGFDVLQLKAFICGPGEAVAYAPGTWHHPMVALDTPGEFSMLVWEDGSPSDCEVRPLSAPVRVSY